MTMLPRLEAEEELSRIGAMSMAFGGTRPAERRRHLARLKRLAGGHMAPAKATPAVLAMMGIGVTVVPPGEGGDG